VFVWVCCVCVCVCVVHVCACVCVVRVRVCVCGAFVCVCVCVWTLLQVATVVPPKYTLLDISSCCSTLLTGFVATPLQRAGLQSQISYQDRIHLTHNLIIHFFPHHYVVCLTTSSKRLPIWVLQRVRYIDICFQFQCLLFFLRSSNSRLRLLPRPFYISF